MNEDSDKELLYYDILTDNESSYETAFLPKENIINPTLEKIIKYYENNQSKKAIPIIEKVFKKEVKTQDEYLGYIVASYSLSQQFDKAAETVLIRNKNRKRWDYSLKLDLAQCIRYYSLLNTINDGLDLVDSLNVKYKSPILSHLWTVIPFDNLMHNIEEGIHNIAVLNRHVSKKRIKEIEYVINKYPNDPFISYGYYVIGDYSKAIEYTDSRIYDLCLYAYAYQNVRNLAKKYYFLKIKSFYYIIPAQPIKDKKEVETIRHTIGVFNKFIQQYPHSIYDDDAEFWIAWLSTFLGDYSETVQSLLQSAKTGNHDYLPICEKYLRYLNSTIKLNSDDFKLSLKVLASFDEPDSLDVNEDNFYFQYLQKEIILSYFNTLQINEVINYSLGNNIIELLYDYLYLCIEKGDFDRVEKIYLFLKGTDKFFNKRIDEDYKKLINEILNYQREVDNPEGFVSLILKLKNTYFKESLALNLIESGLTKYKDNYKIFEYLFYLKVRILVINSPYNVDKIVKVFLSRYPDSKYADDLLAESILVDLKVLNNPNRAKENLNYLLRIYGDRNACDNSLKCLAEYYFEYSEPQYNIDWRNNCLLCIKICGILINDFPNSSYLSEAVSMKKKCNTWIGN